MRDLGFAYLAGLFTYLIMGVTFYLSYPYAKSCINAVSEIFYFTLMFQLQIPFDIFNTAFVAI